MIVMVLIRLRRLPMMVVISMKALIKADKAEAELVYSL